MIPHYYRYEQSRLAPSQRPGPNIHHLAIHWRDGSQYRTSDALEAPRIRDRLWRHAIYARKLKMMPAKDH